MFVYGASAGWMQPVLDGSLKRRAKDGGHLFALLSVLLQQIPHGFFNQFIKPPVLIHGEVGQVLSSALGRTVRAVVLL